MNSKKVLVNVSKKQYYCRLGYDAVSFLTYVKISYESTASIFRA
jgi:hypothetical protein